MIKTNECYEQLRSEGLFHGVWKSPYAFFKFQDCPKTDRNGQLCVRVIAYARDSNRRKVLYYPVDDVLNYMVLKSKITKVN